MPGRQGDLGIVRTVNEIEIAAISGSAASSYEGEKLGADPLRAAITSSNEGDICSSVERSRRPRGDFGKSDLEGLASSHSKGDVWA